jgi:aryl-alcohol dehydrogenase-like predicted oxidoreductase
MEHRILGKSGLNVPVIGMGTWQTFYVPGTAAEQNARAVVDRALQAGASFFASSPIYEKEAFFLHDRLSPRKVGDIRVLPIFSVFE